MPETFEISRSRSLLPAFGALCSRLAAAAGLGPRAFASGRQRAWAQSAELVFEALADGGANLRSIDFIAYDDRPAMRWLDRVFDGAFGSERFAHAEPPMLACSAASYAVSRDPDGSESIESVARNVVSIRQGAKDQAFWERSASAFGSESSARAFILGHEAAHALFAQEHLEPVKRALLATRSDLGRRACALLETFALRPNDTDHPHERDLARAVEEAMCDAVGCWAAARAGCPDAAKLAAQWRQNEPNSLPAYRTGWMTQELGPAVETPFLSALHQAMERACELHGPALSLRFGPAASLDLAAQRARRPGLPSGAPQASPPPLAP